jgi:hypothetical protein
MGIGILMVFVVSLVYKGRNRIQKALARYRDKSAKKDLDNGIRLS